MCCESGIALGNIKNNTLKEIFNGDRIKKIREEFLTNNPVTCQKFIDEKGCHKTYTYLEEATSKDVVQKDILSLDVMINGQCNLECVMCDVFSMPNGVYDGTSFWEDCEREVFPFLKNISLKSGEPFIQKDTFKLVDLVYKSNPKCEWSFTTNGHYKFELIKDKIKHLNISEFDLSVDSLKDEVFSNIRKGGNLKKVLNTLNAMIDFRGEKRAQGNSFRLKLSVVVQRDNWKEVKAFIEFAKTKNILVSFIFLYDPFDLSLLNLSKEEKIEISSHYLELLDSDIEYYNILSVIIKPLLNDLKATKQLAQLRLLYVKYLSHIKEKLSPTKKEEVCPLPFSQLFFQPDGKITTCCWLNDYPLGNIKEDRVIDVWNGEKLKKLQKEFLDDNITICKTSIENRKCNIGNNHLRKYVDKNIKAPAKIDLMLNGDCNLDCIMCSIDQEINGIYTEENFFVHAKKDIFPHLDYLDIKGGEPLIQKDIHYLIREVSNSKKDCKWEITTNGFYKFNENIKSLLDLIDIENYTLSIDSLNNEKFEKIRPVYSRYKNSKQGATLDVVLKNLDEVIKYNRSREPLKQFKTTVNICIMKDNYDEIEELLKFVFEKAVDSYFILVDNPMELSILNFPKKKREELFENFLFLSLKYKTTVLIHLLEGLASSLDEDFKDKVFEVYKLRVSPY